MKPIEQVKKEADKRFNELKEEKPDIYTEDARLPFTFGWLAVEYSELRLELISKTKK